MNRSCQTCWPRRRFLVSGVSVLRYAGALGLISLLGGCNDDKGAMVPVENAPDPAQKAKDSMEFYLQSKNKAKVVPKK